MLYSSLLLYFSLLLFFSLLLYSSLLLYFSLLLYSSLLFICCEHFIDPPCSTSRTTWSLTLGHEQQTDFDAWPRTPMASKWAKQYFTWLRSLVSLLAFLWCIYVKCQKYEKSKNVKNMIFDKNLKNKLFQHFQKCQKFKWIKF